MICVYESNCTDFSNNGLGVVKAQSCTVTETLNGEYEVTLVHPLDEYGQWERLVEGRILRVPVPSGMTPKVKMEAQRSSAGTAIYRIDTSNGTTPGGTLRLRAKPSTSASVIKSYKNNSEVVLISQTNASWYEVTTPDGNRGYMSSQYLVYVRTEGSISAAAGEVVEAKLLRDQPFRIYRVVPDLEKVTVYARHLFYDLMDNMIKKVAPSSSEHGASVVQAISSGCLSQHGFSFHSDLTSTSDDMEILNMNPVDALLGDEGVIDKYGGELARDWWDVYLVNRVGSDTDITLRQGKNLTAVSYDIDETDVVTRIMPTGEDKDGEVLYLPETFVDSPHVNDYPNVKWYHLEVSDAKESDSGDAPKSKSQCYTEMRQAAQTEFDNGCDLPTVTLTVNFLNAADVVEFQQYHSLQDIFLGDTVRVIASRIGVSVSMRMTQYTYDCLTEKYTSMTLGTAADTPAGNTISRGQLASGSITGSKLAINSVGSGALQSGSVGSLQIKMAAIETAHIQDAAITEATIANAAVGTAKIQDASITSAKIAEGSIETAHIGTAVIDSAQIKDGAITSAKIENGTINSADIGRGQIQEANIHDGAITHAKIADAAILQANIADAAIGTAQIADAAITNAKVAGAAIGTANIQDAAIVSAKILDGSVTRAKIADLAVNSAKIADLAVTTAKIAQASITNAKIANAAVDTAQIALGAITAALIENGAVGTAQIADASITDAKIVSLNADVINSGTLATERLIIKGDDGLIYEINAQSSGLTMQELSKEKYQNQLSGSVLVARSVTAEQIAAATITANEILAGSITGDRIAANTIEGRSIKAGTITTSHVSSDFGSTLDLSSNAGINLRVQSINDDIEEVRSAAVASVQVQYALSVSGTSPPSTGWSTTAPTWVSGKHMWQKTVTTYADGTTDESNPTCLSGAEGEAATTLRIESSRGTVFKRDDLTTVLTAVIYHGSQRITTVSELRSTYGSTAYLQWKWRRRDDSGYGVISSSDSRIGAGGFSFLVSASDVDANVTFMCELITD